MFTHTCERRTETVCVPLCMYRVSCVLCLLCVGLVSRGVLDKSDCALVCVFLVDLADAFPRKSCVSWK